MEAKDRIVVFGWMKDGEISEGTKQLLSAGKHIGKLMNSRTELVFLGGEFTQETQTAYAYGADAVYLASHELLENYVADTCLDAIEQVIEQLAPRVVLFMHDDRGMETAPRLAFRLKAGVTTDCIDFVSGQDGTSVDCIKPVLGGKANGKYHYPNGPLIIATVREGAFEAAAYRDADESPSTKALNISLGSAKIRTTLVKKEKDDNLELSLKLASASTAVAIGRGLKKKEGMDVVRKVADKIGGALCGSRPAVDKGWIPYSLQIGLTGKKIHPNLYIAIGISGAIQHMAGCMKSKTIVAVNNDENAPIFRMSHFGVVGEYAEVLGGFLKELEAANSERH